MSKTEVIITINDDRATDSCIVMTQSDSGNKNFVVEINNRTLNTMISIVTPEKELSVYVNCVAMKQLFDFLQEHFAPQSVSKGASVVKF